MRLLHAPETDSKGTFLILPAWHPVPVSGPAGELLQQIPSSDWGSQMRGPSENPPRDKEPFSIAGSLLHLLLAICHQVVMGAVTDSEHPTHPPSWKGCATS